MLNHVEPILQSKRLHLATDDVLAWTTCFHKNKRLAPQDHPGTHYFDATVEVSETITALVRIIA